MKILLLAPEPFFQERGTPIAIKLLAETLCEQNYEVDLLTYHEGTDISIKGLRILRIPKIPFIKKYLLDFLSGNLLLTFSSHLHSWIPFY